MKLLDKELAWIKYTWVFYNTNASSVSCENGLTLKINGMHSFDLFHIFNNIKFHIYEIIK